MSQVRQPKLVDALFFLQKAGCPLKSVSSISPVPKASSQPLCTSLSCPPRFSSLCYLPSLSGLPIPVCSPALYCNDPSQPNNFWPYFYSQTSVLVFWQLHFFKPILSVLPFKSVSSPPAPSVWSFPPDAFEFAVSRRLVWEIQVMLDQFNVQPNWCWTIIRRNSFSKPLGLEQWICL